MGYETNIKTGKQAVLGIANGVNIVANAVKLTLGAAGRNAVLWELHYPFHMVTNDGISIARKAEFEDPLEQIGANLIKEVADRSNKESGDGTTTSIVLTQAILNEGLKQDISGMQIKNSLDELVPFILEKIDEQKKDITEAEVEAVATISSESPKLGKIIGEIYTKIGKDGIIELENSRTYDTTYEIKEGVRIKDCGLISPYLANDAQKAVWKKPKILITFDKIGSLADIIPLAERMDNAGISKELVIFYDEMDPSVVSTLIANHIAGGFKVLLLKAPTLFKDLIYLDFAKITGATIVSAESGVTLKNVGLEHLGTCDKIVTDKDETTILGIKDISDHIAELKANGDDKSMLRVSYLTTKAAILKLGANSESELSYIRLKAEDAINASRLALSDGIVAGGGVCLRNISNQLPDTLGGKILKEALRSPFRQIAENAGIIDMADANSYTETIGVDAKSKRAINMWEANIVDPAKVVKNSIKNAISVAGTVLTSEIVITKPKPKQEDMIAQIMEQQQRPF